MIKRFLKQILIILLVAFVAFMIINNIAFFKGWKSPYNNSVIIDTDSGNEIDDIYALIRALIDSDLEVTGLLSTQWNFAGDAPDTSVKVSQEINEKILKLLNKTDIPHPSGAGVMLPFGEKAMPQPSDAAKFIITRAHQIPSGEKLKVVTLGAVTNLASAILMDTTIIPKLDCYIVGLKYDHIKRIWNKNEFNTRNDLDAMDVILNTKNLDLTVMTVTASDNLKFQKKETLQKSGKKGDICYYMLECWNNKYPEHEELIMRDVTIIEAILHPKFAQTMEVYTPPENTRRKIKIYTKIKAEAMLKDYWKALENYSSKF